MKNKQAVLIDFRFNKNGEIMLTYADCNKVIDATYQTEIASADTVLEMRHAGLDATDNDLSVKDVAELHLRDTATQAKIILFDDNKIPALNAYMGEAHNFVTLKKLYSAAR